MLNFKITELKDTVDLMNSDDYKDRLKAEFYQTKIRYDKLHEFIIKTEAGVADNKVPLDILKRQARAMGEYLYILETYIVMYDLDI